MENMEHVQVDPLSLHGACPTLLGVKASFLNNLGTFNNYFYCEVDQQQVDQRGCTGEDYNLYLFKEVSCLILDSYLDLAPPLPSPLSLRNNDHSASLQSLPNQGGDQLLWKQTMCRLHLTIVVILQINVVVCKADLYSLMLCIR